MQSLTTGYTVYYNLKNNYSGHLFQGRFGAKLVDGDSYLLSLTRYVHLNPVCIATVKMQSLEKRLAKLNSYGWSSYGGYVDKSKALDFVEYEPVLAMVDARGDSVARKKYRSFVEDGIAQSDDEFMQVKDASPHSIGSLEFDCRVRRLYKALVEESGVPKDAAFRDQVEAIPPDVVVDAVCNVFGVDKEYICTRQRGCMIRPVTAQMLCRFSGMTKRAVAEVLNLSSGAAVGSQIRKLMKVQKDDDALKSKVKKIETCLEEQCNQ
ncbi:MAG: hypothetical protein PF904_01985 [Kiritimatiellae bacterium]|jgi:putative transposase|nr:hypothetical protein [Kiritimatiellia bacterium]